MPKSATASCLSARVREHTAAAHSSAESRPFITALMRGELDLAAYARYLGQLAPIYAAIEARRSLPSDPPMIDRRLDRLPSIENDLAALGAAPWQDEPPLAATERYATHVSSIDEGDLPRYLAHHYTRYLGDLSGGQAIARLVARHYGATPEQLSYYDFAELGSTVQFKRDYRDALDALEFDDTDAELFLDEAGFAFACNEAIFDELGSR